MFFKFRFLLCALLWPFFVIANPCLDAIQRIEDQQGIPKLLMNAIAVIESGRVHPNDKTKKMEPWPWTINVNGKGYYFETKTAALSKVRQCLREGIKNIDVGCMQINLNHHPKAFPSLDDAFDPYKNALYAAKFLKDLMQEKRSWSMAVGHYHSRAYQHYISYRKRVYDQWNREKLKKAGIYNITSVGESRKRPNAWFSGLKSPLKVPSIAPRMKVKNHYHFLFPHAK